MFATAVIMFYYSDQSSPQRDLYKVYILQCRNILITFLINSSIGIFSEMPPSPVN